MEQFASIHEQITLLKRRNLKFKAEDSAYKYLLQHNFYNIINYYSEFFYQEEHTYSDGVYFEHIQEIHHFDKEIKSVIFHCILEAERHFKSILAYRYSEYFRDKSNPYLDISNYDKKYTKEATKFIKNIQNIIERQKKLKKDKLIKHYLENDGNIPFSVLINYFTFGNVKHFYNYVPETIRNKVAKDLTMYLKNNNLPLKDDLKTKVLQNAINNLLELRNITAHNSKLIGTKLPNNIPYFATIHDFHDIDKEKPRQDIYSTIIFLKLFLNKNEYAKLNNTIKKRVNNLRNKIDKVYFEKIIHSIGIYFDLETIQQD